MWYEQYQPDERVVNELEKFLRILDRQLGIDMPMFPTPRALVQFRAILEVEILNMDLGTKATDWLTKQLIDLQGYEEFVFFARDVSNALGTEFPGSSRTVREERLGTILASYEKLKQRLLPLYK